MVRILTFFMEIYLIEERYDDVICSDQNCKQKINCARRIHKVTQDKELAIKLTKYKPNWGYMEFELE